MRILEEFWYGNIEPTEYDTCPCAEYKKALQLIRRNEEKLQSTMTDAQKELFSRYVDSVREFRPLRKFCVSDIRQNQEYHIIHVHDGGLFPLSTSFPGGWDGMRAGTA